MSEPELVVEGLGVRYGHVTAVDGVALTVGRGEIVTVIGANGAGKSSTLNALSGACAGTVSGHVRLAGRPLPLRRAHRIVRHGMVLVPEGRRVIAPLTVAENLQLGGYRHRSRKRVAQLLAEVYELFPVLQERRATPAGLLSGGEQQMLAFGRAMMASPRVVLLDEPSMGLAPAMVDRVMDAVGDINRRGVSVLVVEQNAAAVLRVATRAYVLDRGRIVHAGTAAEVVADPIVARTFLGLLADGPGPDEAVRPQRAGSL